MRKLQLVLLGLLIVVSSRAQIFTVVPPPPGNIYYEAPIIDCWLFGAGHYEYFTGDNNLLLGPTAFCGVVDNPGWLAFTSRTVSGFMLDITVSSCTNNDGIQVQIYEAVECDLAQFYPIGECFDQIFSTQTVTLALNNLHPNSLYYIFIDGYDGDMCNYALETYNVVAAPPDQPYISGPTSVLSGHTYIYEIDGLGYNNACGNLEYIDASFCLPMDTSCTGPLSPIWTAPPGSFVQVNPDGSASITIGSESGLITVDYLCYHAELWVVVNAVLDNCQNNSPGALTSCAEAPQLCGDLIQGYCGSTTGQGPLNQGNLATLGLCNMPNTHWIKFAPCDNAAVFELAVSGCLLGSGLNMAVVQSDDCANFTVINGCTVLPADLSTTVTVSGLLPGHWYYILIAGQGGDFCEFGLAAISGVDSSTPTANINEITPGYIDGPPEVCFGASATFTLVPPVYEVTVNSGSGCPLPPDACSNSAQADSLNWVWHIPPGAVFLSDSVNVLSVDVMFNDTTDGYVWVEYQIGASDTTQLDTLGACACTFAGALSSIEPFFVNVIYNIVEEYLFTTCDQPCVQGCSGVVCGSNATMVCQIDCGFLIQHIVYNDIMPPVDLGVFVYCEGQCHFFNGVPYCASGTYTEIIILPQGCIQMVTFTVIIEPTQIIDLGQITLCEGECFPLGASSYCAPGFYSVPGFDPITGCPNITNFELQVLPQSIINFGQITLCEGECFPLGTSSYCAPGFYSVPGFDPITGCPNITNFELIIQQVEDMDLGVITLCEGECFTYAGLPFCAEGDFNVSQPDPVTGCLANVHFAIVRPIPMPVVVSAPVIICNAPQTHYTLSFNLQGTPPFFVNGAAILNGNYLSAPLETGTDYYFEIYDSSPCSSDEAVILSGSYDCGPLCLSSPGTMLAGTLEPCTNETAIAGQPTGYALAPGDVSEFILHTLPDEVLGTVISRNTTGEFAFDPGQMLVSQTYYISFIVGPPTPGGQVDLGSACLSIAKGRPVIFNPSPQLTINGDTLLTCDLSELTLSGQSDMPLASSKWQGPGNFVANDMDIQVATPGLYELEATTIAGCTATAQQWINQDISFPQIDTGEDAAWPCTESTITLNAYIDAPEPGNYAIQWTGANDTAIVSGAQSLQPVISAPGWYYCEVRDLNNGCISTDSLLLTASGLHVDLGPDRQVKFGESLTLTGATNASLVSIHWANSAGESFQDELSWTVQPLQNTLFVLAVTDTSGCLASDEVWVNVLPHNKLYAPNAFSPNGDGINDHFTLYGFDADIAMIEQIHIYDRWGGLVFQQTSFPLNDESKGWNGSYKAKPAAEGVYIYQATVVLVNGETFQLSGDVTLVR